MTHFSKNSKKEDSMDTMIQFFKEHMTTLRFLTENEIPKYLRDRAVFRAEHQKLESDYEKGKIESDEEMDKRLECLVVKYAVYWFDLIGEREKYEKEKLDR